MFRRQFLQTSKRFLSVTFPKNNAVSELYLKELKNVKLPEINLADANVKPFHALKVSPYANDILQASESEKDALKSYESEPVEVLKAVQETDAAEQTGAEEEDWLVIEDDVEEETHH
ncbi:hypothetical protein ACO0RG_003333 [Hanseniaspora osmophila]|uniref:ATP synthase subunit H, mitochondrial n=1 Tax=Hanseniaspora osmophila TaxID=56408 RepID=A0A1E5RDI3_9ASCO|nr:hypothetical protein AWRI3579_g1978 [Hanseniaspora osmophila]